MGQFQSEMNLWLSVVGILTKGYLTHLTYSGLLTIVLLQTIVLYLNYFSEKFVETEIWNFNNGNNMVINPALPNMDYSVNPGLYIVPFDFCTF